MQSEKIFKLNNNDNFKFLKNKEELQDYAKVLIEYFNKNTVNKDFEKQLIRQLNKYFLASICNKFMVFLY